MKILIVEPFITGHYLEYLNHIYKMTLDMPDDEFVFVLPESFNDSKKLMEWPENKNVTFDLSLPTKDRVGGKKSLVKSWQRAVGSINLYKNFCKKYNPDGVFCIDIMSVVPLMPFIIRQKLKVIGVVYDIYLRIDNPSLRTRLANYCRYIILSKSRIFHKVFILNDKTSAAKLNYIYKTNKYSYLPDPFVPIQQESFDFKKQYSINKDEIVFAHFGSLTRRKGTLDILNVIKSMKKTELSHYVFIFAGRVNAEIKDEFYSLVAELNGKTKIIVKDEFCSFAFISSLCNSSNAILIPYRDTCKSSGLIGYASQFTTPVVSYSSGLLGELVKSYKLGYTIDTIEDLPNALYHIAQGRVALPTDEYCKDNQVSSFQEYIRKSFLNSLD